VIAGQEVFTVAGEMTHLGALDQRDTQSRDRWYSGRSAWMLMPLVNGAPRPRGHARVRILWENGKRDFVCLWCGERASRAKLAREGHPDSCTVDETERWERWWSRRQA